MGPDVPMGLFHLPPGAGAAGPTGARRAAGRALLGMDDDAWEGAKDLGVFAEH